ncbi:MAG: hypothetical protein CVU18_05815 [Betaproteobacteria bacterium HGW-Betaproteobacteria-12]|nr:MAG: hypothetical protein CVU18_05815 [Betaproteobacteria bacterium HGW-Betaproteobacteria-12]
MSHKSISIIIPTAGSRSPKMLERTLSSLADEKLPDRKIEIIVIENGNSYGCDAICRKLSKRLPILYKFLPHPNVSLARNLGISTSTGDLLIFFDDDIRFSGKCIENYSIAYEQFGENHFYGGPVKIDYESPPDNSLMPFLPLSAKGLDFGDEIVEVSDKSVLFLGANLAIPRVQLEKLGTYDSHGPNGINSGFIGEETRLQIRLMNNGLTGLFLPNALIWHYVPTDSCNLSWLKKRYYRMGLTEGALLKSTENIATIFGMPRYAIRQIIINFFEISVTALSEPNNQKRISALLERQRLAGLISSFLKGINQTQ